MNKIRTICASCLFRQNDENGNQNGCELNRLEKFKKKGLANRIDDYYEINRFCNTCRDKGYTKESILKEIELSCGLIVYGWNDYWITLRSILKQTVKPKVVYVIFDDMKLFNREKYYEYQEMYHNNGIILNFKYFFEEKTDLEMIDEIIPKIKTQYYAYIKRSIDKDFISKYNQIINYDLEPLVAEIQKGYLNSFISCVLHKTLMGNKDKCITDKIKEFVKDKSEKERKSIIIN